MRIAFLKSYSAIFLSLQCILILLFFLRRANDSPEAVKRVDAETESNDSVLFRDLRWTRCKLIQLGTLSKPDPTKPDACTWWMCQELYDNMRHSKDCLVYTFGAGGNVRFDKELARDGCEVHTFEIAQITGEAMTEIGMFHATSVFRNIKSSKHAKFNWHYHNVGIDSKDDSEKNVLSLSTIVTTLKHEHRFIHYLKLHIDGTEFRILDDIAQLSARIGTIGLAAHPFQAAETTPLNVRSDFDQLLKLEAKGFRLIRRDLMISFDAGGHLYRGHTNWKYEKRDPHSVQHEVFLFLATYAESYFVNQQYLNNVREITSD